jgi:predicted alpha/beta hydrolase family esterase
MQLIMDGRVVPLIDEWYAQKALEAIEAAPEGDVLVAISYDGRVLVRWIDQQASVTVVPMLRAADYKVRSKGVKPTKKVCPWLHTAVEVEFDHVASEHGDSIRALHASNRDEMVARGRTPDSYRRWLSKLKKRWVRAVVSNGKRVEDLETLASSV